MDPLGRPYERAFATFLAHTDQKDRALARLTDIVAGLPNRRVLVDAGAGTGLTTGALAARFGRTIAIEPSPHLPEALQREHPQVTVLPELILDADPGAEADLVLCSHVLYYIPQERWPEHVTRMTSWLAPGGEAVIILQNPGSDCMRMLHHFTGRLPDLRPLVGIRPGWPSWIETVPSMIAANDLDTATTIAEFILNLGPLTPPPPLSDLRAYLRDSTGGTYRLTCTQDFLRIRRPA